MQVASTPLSNLLLTSYPTPRPALHISFAPIQLFSVHASKEFCDLVVEISFQFSDISLPRHCNITPGLNQQDVLERRR